MGFPDALKLPTSWKQGRTPQERKRYAEMVNADPRKAWNLVQRCQYVLNIADEFLGVDASAGEKSYMRDACPSFDAMFVTKNMGDTILFPSDHPKSGRNRYRWVEQPDGSAFGYLIEKPIQTFTMMEAENAD